MPITMPPRLLVLLLASAVGVLFAVGLFVHGIAGAVVLLIVAAILVAISRTAWADVRSRGRPLRILVVATIVVLAVVKLAGAS